MGVVVYDDGCGNGAKGGGAPNVGFEGGDTVRYIKRADVSTEQCILVYVRERKRREAPRTCGPGTSSSGNWSSNFSISSFPVTLTSGIVSFRGASKSSKLKLAGPPDVVLYVLGTIVLSPPSSSEMSGNAEAALSKSMSPLALTADEGAVANSEPMSGKSVIIVSVAVLLVVVVKESDWCGCVVYSRFDHAIEHPWHAGALPAAHKPAPRYPTPHS